MTSGPGDRIVALYRRPLNRGIVDPASGSAEIANPLCGDRLRLTIGVAGGRITDARFVGDACAVSTAAASLLTEAIRGVSLDELAAWDGDRAMALLDAPLPAGRRRCATLPLDGLQAAGAQVAARARLLPVVLAAGRASRFGGDKVLAEFEGEPIVRHVVRAMATLGREVLVVAGANNDGVRRALDGLPARVVENDAPGDGLASSLAIAARAANDGGDEALLVALADQPTLDPAVVVRVADAGLAVAGPAAVARYDGERGHPVFLAREIFPTLLANEGDVGARAILAALGDRVLVVEVAGPPPPDIDTPADMARVLRERGYVGNTDPHEDGHAAGS